MDIALDTSALSEFRRESSLATSVCRKIREEQKRLALPLLALLEFSDADNPSQALERLSHVVALADQLGGRFFITQEVGDLIRIEREERLSSIPRIPTAAQAQWIEAFRSGAVINELPKMRKRIQQYQQKEERFQRDRKTRDDHGERFAHLAKRLDASLDNMSKDDGYWTLVFVEVASERFKYRDRMRAFPQRYATANIQAAYGTLIAYGAIFARTQFGSYAGVLRGPRRNDWTDCEIAASASHAHVLLSEDQGQRDKVNYIAKQFGLRLRALPVRDWLV